MARLGAKEKVLWYPTPIEIAHLITSNIIPGQRGSICDPCCGDGAALVTLGSHLNLATYGCELHTGRFLQAQTKIGYCLNGAREFLAVEGQFDVVFSNPPYDQALGGQRMEVLHIQADLELLLPGGLGIWIIPETIVDYDLCQLLTAHLYQIEVRRFPPPAYEQFKQIVIFGVKRSEPATYTYDKAITLEEKIKAGLSVLQANELAYDTAAQGNQITAFSLKLPTTEQVIKEIETTGIHTSETWSSLFGLQGQRINDFQPVLRLTSGHAAMTIAAGIVDGTQVDIEGCPHLIKGSTRKAIKVIQQSEVVEDGTKQTIREREQLVQTITAFDLQDGRLLTYDSQDDHNGFAAFLMTHQQALVNTIDQQYPPLFDPERDMVDWAEGLRRVRAPGVLPGQKVATGLLAAQQVRVAALAAKLNQNKAVILVGECGSGKTAMSQAIAGLIGRGNWKLVVVCPSQVTRKWKREAKKVLADFGVTIHLIGQKRKQPDGQGKVRTVSKPVLDVIQAMEEPNPSILVLSYQVAKNGPRWQHAVTQMRKPIHYQVEVEQTETLDEYPYKRVVVSTQTVIKMQDVLCCPDCGCHLTDDYGLIKTVSELGRKKRRCQECDAPLWQQIPFQYGGRVAIADLLNRRYSGRYNLILDEAHTVKGSDTDAGYAATDLISGAKKVIAMTGTLYAGRASSIFYLLYRLFPHFRALYGYNEVQRFIMHHGLQETITTVTPSKQWSSTYGYKRENVRVRELPGVSPGMVTMLLNNTAFIKLADMGLQMPSYMEERLPIQLDERLQVGLNDIEKIYKTAAKLARENKPGLLSSWLYASLGWLDNPVDEVLCETNDQGEVVSSHPITGVLSQSDEVLDTPLAKDQALIELIEAELGQGRGVGVFFSQVNRRDWMGRIQKTLEKQGIYSEILRQSTCKPEDREAWYRSFVKRCRADQQEPVLLGNGSLVKEGLDLVELPTLVETGIEHRINDLRQRDRRAWRLIQDKPCKVVFLYYQDSMQETALKLVAAKLKAALTVDGDLAEGLAAMDVDGSNLLDALIKAVRQGRTNEIAWSGMEVAQAQSVDSVVIDNQSRDLIVPEVWTELPLFANPTSEAETITNAFQLQKRSQSKKFAQVEIEERIVQLSLFA